MLENKPKQRRGFAAMSLENRQELARRGGQAAHALGRAHKFTPEEARVAGAKGGQKCAEDREHMSEIGRRGGVANAMKKKAKDDDVQEEAKA